MATQGDNQVLASLDYAASLLTPTADAAPNRQFRAPFLAMQNVLFRILRPYWWQQRQIQRLLIDALRQVSLDTARAVKADQHQRQALEAVWSGLHLLESVAKGNHVAAHLEALTKQLELTTAQATELSQRLYAIPYMDESQRFSYVQNGKPVLGYRGRQTDEGQGYAGFEDIFRGPESFIAGRMRIYVPLLRRHGRVLESAAAAARCWICCATRACRQPGSTLTKGWWRGAAGKGMPLNGGTPSGTCANSRTRRFLRSSPPKWSSTCRTEELMTFLHVSLAKLAPGGQLIFETVNPHAIEAFKTFWTDLTHQRPIFPEVAVAWCWLMGFDQAYVDLPGRQRGPGQRSPDSG